MSGQIANDCPACAILKAYRDTDLFMTDIECVFCQTVIPALPSNGNDTNIHPTDVPSAIPALPPIGQNDTVEKRTRDPTKPKEPKTNKETIKQGQGTSDETSKSKQKNAFSQMTDQNAIKTVDDLTELDRQVVNVSLSREIVVDLEAKLMVDEAKTAALQSDLDAKENERKLYNDKFKQYGRENRELKKELAEMETNRKPKSSVSKKTGKAKVISQTPKRSETASTSQVEPVASSVPKLGIIPALLPSNGNDDIEHDLAATDVPSVIPAFPSNGKNNTAATDVPPVLQAGEPTENISGKRKDEDKLKDCRLLWISGLEKTVKAEDLRVAFEHYGKVENGKIVTMKVNGIKECHGIFTMRTAKDTDNVIKHMNGSKIEAGNQLIQIEKRTRDPTKPKESKTNKEVGNRSTCAQQDQGTSDGNSKEKTASHKMTDVEKSACVVCCSHPWCSYSREEKSSRYQGMVKLESLAADCEKTLMKNHELTCEQNRNKGKRFNRDASGKRGQYVPIATHGMGHKKPKTEPLD